ncbi:MAG: 6-phosphofructokinase [Kouleothrix sp.]
MPATINNNLPGSELSIGADTALNNIVEVVDKIKQSAVAARRCFVVEVMGRNCGYLALMSGMAAGAERVYLNEEGVTLHDLEADPEHLADGFRSGKRLGLSIRNSAPARSIPPASWLRCLKKKGATCSGAPSHPRAPAAGRRSLAVRSYQATRLAARASST